MKTIYFAGPDVFLPRKEYDELTFKISTLCEEHGFQPVFPTDNMPENISKSDKPGEIFRANEAFIHNSDYVIANLNPFRGTEPDSGTVWEVAFAYALNKHVVAYMKDNCTVKERVEKHFEVESGSISKQTGIMPDGMNVEDFGFPVNLMLQKSIMEIVHGGYEEAIKYLAEFDKSQ
jgi:nucleoside 2-deoxyribosyltransferase